MNAERFERSVESLARAFESREPIPPFTDEGELTVSEAYAIQEAVVERWRSAGDDVVGHKVGLTSEAMRRQLGVDNPDFGHLMRSMRLPDGGEVPADRFNAPRVEPEIGFVLSSPLAGPGVGMAEAIQAVEFVVPTLEIIDSRIQDWRITLADTIADNASCGAFVVGANPTALRDVDLRLVGCNVWRNGELVASGAGGAVLGSPLRSLVWLANTLGEQGTKLEAGQVILPGACTAAVPIAPGDVFTAEFAVLGSVEIRFGKEF